MSKINEHPLVREGLRRGAASLRRLIDDGAITVKQLAGVVCIHDVYKACQENEPELNRLSFDKLLIIATVTDRWEPIHAYLSAFELVVLGSKNIEGEDTTKNMIDDEIIDGQIASAVISGDTMAVQHGMIARIQNTAEGLKGLQEKGEKTNG